MIKGEARSVPLQRLTLARSKISRAKRRDLLVGLLASPMHLSDACERFGLTAEELSPIVRALRNQALIQLAEHSVLRITDKGRVYAERKARGEDERGRDAKG